MEPALSIPKLVRGARPVAEAALRLRSRRVTLAVIAAAVLGLVDLAFTLTFMRSIGMFEANPVARAMIDLGGASQLINFKLFTIVLSGGVLYLLRRHPSAELCAWICLAGLVALSIHWTIYTQALISFGTGFDPQLAALDPTWVVLTD